MSLRPLSVASLVVVSVMAGSPVFAQPASSSSAGSSAGAVSVNPAESSTLPVEEERPDFQPLRPSVPGEDAAPAPVPAPVERQDGAATVSVPAGVHAAKSAPAAMAPVATRMPAAQPADEDDDSDDGMDDAIADVVLPWWVVALLVVGGALLAGGVGVAAAWVARGGEAKARRRAVAATLAMELDTRRQAFEAVPTPPNIEAGVSFVSAVISTAAIDCGFRAAQGQLFLLPPQLAANISVHYAAVQRVADFVKGQSLAAAVRMLQANRLGGHPCPDAGAMREAHMEASAAFRGVDKLITALKSIARA